MKLRTIVGEAFRSLRATVSTTVAATLTVLIGMFVLGLSIAFGTWFLSWSDHLKQELVVNVYMKNSATASQTLALKRHLLTDSRVKEIRVTTPAQGLAEEVRERGAVGVAPRLDPRVGRVVLSELRHEAPTANVTMGAAISRLRIESRPNN